jgi:hypothetical protein
MSCFLLRVTGTVALGIASAGCAAVKYETVPYDTPRVADLRACAHPERGRVEPCLALVRASEWHSPSGLQVTRGMQYCIEVPEGQRWFDKSLASSPPHGEDHPKLDRFAAMKRVPGQQWFALMVAVAPEKPGRPQTDGKWSPPKETDTAPVAAGASCGQKGWRFQPAQPGELVFFPNDAVSPIGDKRGFYRNNSGQIWVKITPSPVGGSM